MSYQKIHPEFIRSVTLLKCSYYIFFGDNIQLNDVAKFCCEMDDVLCIDTTFNLCSSWVTDTSYKNLRLLNHDGTFPIFLGPCIVHCALSILPSTSTHSHPLPPTPTHFHTLPSTATHSYPLPPTPNHSQSSKLSLTFCSESLRTTPTRESSFMLYFHLLSLKVSIEFFLCVSLESLLVCCILLNFCVLI